MSEHTKGKLKEFASHLMNDQLDSDENYRSITVGGGYLGNGFNLTGFITPADAARIVAGWNFQNKLEKMGYTLEQALTALEAAKKGPTV